MNLYLPEAAYKAVVGCLCLNELVYQNKVGENQSCKTYLLAFCILRLHYPKYLNCQTLFLFDTLSVCLQQTKFKNVVAKLEIVVEN